MLHGPATVEITTMSSASVRRRRPDRASAKEIPAPRHATPPYKLVYRRATRILAKDLGQNGRTPFGRQLCGSPVQLPSTDAVWQARGCWQGRADGGREIRCAGHILADGSGSIPAYRLRPDLRTRLLGKARSRSARRQCRTFLDSFACVDSWPSVQGEMILRSRPSIAAGVGLPEPAFESDCEACR